MLNGTVYRRPRLVRLTDVTDYLSSPTEQNQWPTPTPSDCHIENLKSEQLKEGGKRSMNLPKAVKTWPTPTRRMADRSSGKIGRIHNKKPEDLSAAVKIDLENIMNQIEEEYGNEIPQTYPTPTANMMDMSTMEKQRTSGQKRAKNKLYPTPRGSKGGVGMCGGTGSREMIQTLRESEQITEEEKKSMISGRGGQLSPLWVEWLMGFPPEWTDLDV